MVTGIRLLFPSGEGGVGPHGNQTVSEAPGAG